MKQKNNIWIYTLIVMGSLLFLCSNCKKDESDPTIVKDIDGNVYHIVTIGTQVWMVENLKVTRYRNGDSISNVTDGTEWGNLKTGAYCEYDNLPENGVIYGKLYNFYAVADSRNIAPVGWHVPTYPEFTALTNFLKDSIGCKLKETGTEHWRNPNVGATNATGFTALPGGYRNSHGWDYINCIGYFWSSTESSVNYAWVQSMLNIYTFVYPMTMPENIGYSVRCIRD